MPDGPDRDDDRPRASIPVDDLRRLREAAKLGRKAEERIRELAIELELERHRASPVLRVIARSHATSAEDVRELLTASGIELRDVEDDQGDEQTTYQHNHGDDHGPELDDDEQESTELRRLLSENR